MRKWWNFDLDLSKSISSMYICLSCLAFSHTVDLWLLARCFWFAGGLLVFYEISSVAACIQQKPTLISSDFSKVFWNFQNVTELLFDVVKAISFMIFACLLFELLLESYRQFWKCCFFFFRISFEWKVCLSWKSSG